MNSIPEISKKICWTSNDKLVEIIMENKGIMNFLLQKIMHKPKKSIIRLDEIGSFVWKNIDGKRTTEEIAQKLEQKFGKKASPLQHRLDQYLKILCEYKFISLKKIKQKDVF